MTHRFQFTERSSNKKTGPIAVTTTSKDSCPKSCPFMGNGCYAESGPLGMLWKKISDAQIDGTFTNGRATLRAIGFEELLQRVKRLPKGQMFRHNQAGDLMGIGLNIDRDALRKLTKAARGKVGFTYTHKPMMGANVDAVREANANGFTVNMSGNSARHAAALRDANPDIPAVCVLLFG